MCVCSTCCCAHFNYEPDYNVSRSVSGGSEGSEGEASSSRSSSVGVSLHMRASIKSVNHAAIWQREGAWKWEKGERKREAEGERKRVGGGAD